MTQSATRPVVRPSRGAALRIASAALLAGVLAGLGHAAAQEGGITVVATGAAFGPPDQAHVDVGFTTTDEDVADALEAADEAIRAVQAAIAAVGVAERDVRTTTFAVWREERFEERAATPAVVYRVTHHLRVTVRDVDAVGRLLVAATDAGANYVGGVTFTVQDARELEATARSNAFDAAREKAEQLARLAGVTLGAPVSIVEVELGGVVPFGGARTAPMLVESMADAPVAGGELAVEVRVEVRFAVADGD